MSSIEVRLYFLIAWVCTTMSGCASYTNATPAETLNISAGETIIVMGIPDNHRIKIARGVTDGPKWRARHAFAVDLHHRWKDGYLVRKIESRTDEEMLGISQVKIRRVGSRFRPCKGEQTLVFKVPPNKVLYLGHVSFDSTSNINDSYRVELEEARVHLQDNFPGIAAQLTIAETEVRELSNVSCNFLLTDFWDHMPITIF